VDRTETHWLLRLEGDYNISSAAELKAALLDGLASSKELELDLEGAGELDITFLQLLWAAEREAGRAGPRLVCRVSETAGAAARGAGFERFPGERV
jgi:hypothetical protein